MTGNGFFKFVYSDRGADQSKAPMFYLGEPHEINDSDYYAFNCFVYGNNCDPSIIYWFEADVWV